MKSEISFRTMPSLIGGEEKGDDDDEDDDDDDDDDNNGGGVDHVADGRRESSTIEDDAENDCIDENDTVGTLFRDDVDEGGGGDMRMVASVAHMSLLMMFSTADRAQAGRGSREDDWTPS